MKPFENISVQDEPIKVDEPRKDVNDSPTKGHPMDSEDARRKHAKLLEWLEQAREAHAENRNEMAIDQDFYDGLQWSEEDVQELQERGQAPLVYNHIKPAVDWLLGTEKRTRVDYRILPRDDSSEGMDSAINKQKLLKYVSDLNKSHFARSMAFSDAARVGVGWLEDGIRNDESEEPLYTRYENWRNMWWDHLAVEKDLSDARYLFRSRWVDLDVALAMFPERQEALRREAARHNSLTDDDDLWRGDIYQRTDEKGRYLQNHRSYSSDPYSTVNRRERVRLIECWYKEPIAAKIIRGDSTDPINGQIFDPENPKHVEAMDEKMYSTFDALYMQMRVAIMTENHLMQDMPSPYSHNRFPFTPIWGFRRGRDGQPYGIIRNTRDPQEDMNKRASKALFILSTNKIIAEKTSVDDWNETLDEAARPDGVIKVNGDKRFELVTDRDLAESHLTLMDRDLQFINNVSGVTEENLGRESSAISGRAILAKQNEGSVVTFELFDNLRYSIQVQGEKQLSLIEQWYDQQKTIRILGDAGEVDFMKMNAPEWDPIEEDWVIKNPVTQIRSDFVVDTQDFRQTVRQALFEQMMEMIGRLPPDISIQLLDLVVQHSDVPGKDEIVARIRAVNGHRDPNEDPTPEEIAQQQAQMAEEQRQKQIAEADALSQIDERKAKSEKTRMDLQGAAIENAAKLAGLPGVSVSADQLLKNSGYQDPEGENQ